MKNSKSAAPTQKPVAIATNPNAGLTRDFVRRVQHRRHIRYTEEILDAAEREGRRRFDEIQKEAFERMRLEALTLLANLPNFTAMRRLPDGDKAYRAIRGVADRYGFPMAAVMGRSHQPPVQRARIEAIRAVCDACPRLSDRVIGLLFSGMSALRVREIRKGPWT